MELPGFPGKGRQEDRVQSEDARSNRKAEKPTLLERESLSGSEANEVSDPHSGGGDSHEERQV